VCVPIWSRDQIGTHKHTDGMNWHTATYRHSL